MLAFRLLLFFTEVALFLSVYSLPLFYLILLHFFSQFFLSNFFDDGSSFCQIFIDDIALDSDILCAAFFLGWLCLCSTLMCVAVGVVVDFLLHIGGVALEGGSKLLDDLLHFGAYAVALLAGLGDNSMRVFFFVFLNG